MIFFSFFKCFWPTYTCTFRGPLVFYTGFLVTSPLGFKVSVGSSLLAFAEANAMCIP